MALGIDGLVSGLDTTALIDALISAESRTRTILTSKVAGAEKLVTELQTLNSNVATLAANAKGWATPAKLAGVTATASAASVSVAAEATAAPGSIAFRVDQVAQSQLSVTAAMTAWSGGPTVTIVGDDGTATEIAAGSSLAQLVANINASGAGVSATLVASGFSGATPQYRIQLAGATGEDGAFSFYDGTEADVDGNTAVDLLAAPGAATVRTAQDAAITLWAGTPAAQQLTSTSNAFADVLPGVDVTISAVEASPVTVTVARNAAAASAAATSLITGVNSILSGIRTKSSVTTTTDDAGNAATSAGVFTGDQLTRRLSASLSRAVMDPVDGVSPSAVGITISRTGVLTFDAAAFGAAMTADPTGTQEMLATISGRVQAVAESASDSIDGQLTSRITGQKTSIASMEKQISEWDDRLARRRATLELQYAAMETALSGLKSTSDYLAQQLNSLTSSSKGSS